MPGFAFAGLGVGQEALRETRKKKPDGVRELREKSVKNVPRWH